MIDFFEIMVEGFSMYELLTPLTGIKRLRRDHKGIHKECVLRKTGKARVA